MTPPEPLALAFHTVVPMPGFLEAVDVLHSAFNLLLPMLQSFVADGQQVSIQQFEVILPVLQHLARHLAAAQLSHIQPIYRQTLHTRKQLSQRYMMSPALEPCLHFVPAVRQP